MTTQLEGNYWGLLASRVKNIYTEVSILLHWAVCWISTSAVSEAVSETVSQFHTVSTSVNLDNPDHKQADRAEVSHNKYGNVSSSDLKGT